MNRTSALLSPFCGGSTGHRWISSTKCRKSGALMALLVSFGTSCRTNNRVAGVLRPHNAHASLPLWRWRLITENIHWVSFIAQEKKHLSHCRGDLAKPPFNLGHGLLIHDDVIEWKHFPRYWPFVRGIHRSPVNSPYKGQWRGAFMFSLICAWINRWINNREAGDLRRYRPHYDVIVMYIT